METHLKTFNCHCSYCYVKFLSSNCIKHVSICKRHHQTISVNFLFCNLIYLKHSIGNIVEIVIVKFLLSIVSLDCFNLQNKSPSHNYQLLVSKLFFNWMQKDTITLMKVHQRKETRAEIKLFPQFKCINGASN